MSLFLILVITEVLTLVVIRQHFYDKSWMKFYFTTIINALISLWLWILWLEIITHNGFFDEPGHIWLKMCFTGMLSAVVIPRIILSAFHFTGRLLKRKQGDHNRLLTNIGITISLIILVVVAVSTLKGRFNFKTEELTIRIKGLHRDLDGIRIVHISDIHLPSFHHHQDLLMNVMERINSYDPDILFNTGDFITYGWREFGHSDTVLNHAKSRYGNFAIMGNHDFGTYHPDFTEADKNNNILLMNKFISSSGFKVLNDESLMLKIGDAWIGLAGVTTKGSFPDIIHGNLAKASVGIDSADLKILLSHDPNHWDKSVRGLEDFDITFSGHTHGMQIGVMTKKVRWSPAKYFYPYWNGLYTEQDQHLVVNRGLGVLGMPFRIWMPPEITLITLEAG